MSTTPAGTSQGVQHRVFYRDGHPSRYQPRPTGLNFGEQTETGGFPLVIAVPPVLFTTIHREYNNGGVIEAVSIVFFKFLY